MRAALRAFVVAMVAAGGIGAGGCGRSLETYLAERKEEVAQKLARLEEVRKLLGTMGPIAADTMSDPGPMAICDLVVPAFREKSCNTWVSDLKQFLEPHRYLEPRPIVTFGMANWFVLPTSLVQTGRYPPNEHYPEGAEVEGVTRAIEAAFRWLANVKYVIVVRALEEKLPTVSEDQKGYNPGSFRGEALLFQLEPEVSSLGGAAFEYTTAGSLQVHMQNGQIKSSELEAAFARGVRDQLAAKLVERLQNLERPSK